LQPGRAAWMDHAAGGHGAPFLLYLRATGREAFHENDISDWRDTCVCGLRDWCRHRVQVLAVRWWASGTDLAKRAILASLKDPESARFGSVATFYQLKNSRSAGFLRAAMAALPAQCKDGERLPPASGFASTMLPAAGCSYRRAGAKPIAIHRGQATLARISLFIEDSTPTPNPKDHRQKGNDN